MNEIVKAIRNFLKERFNLNEDKAEEKEIVANIHRDVSFKGTNLWTLIFAIMIASIGLNVNSTAVIIGAMLISPLMGPIMGIGLGVGTNDFDLMKKGIKNLAIAAIISILTSAFYFAITPIHNANSELLARTNPSLWDVFIAFFGGLAGIVAGTRTQKSTVIPGVAIATALMPPLCTAGFGLATGKWFYLMGAAYLFFINSLLICLATFLIVKHLRFHKKEFQSREAAKRVSRYIWTIVFITVLPSIYLAYRIAERTIFEGSANNFIQNEFHFPKTQVINKTFRVEGRKKTIELLLLGQELSSHVVDSLQNRLPAYGMYNTSLVVHQGLNAKQQVDLAQIKASILEDVFNEEKRKDTGGNLLEKMEITIPNLDKELKSLYPTLKTFSLSRTIFHDVDSPGRHDTMHLLVMKFKNSIPTRDKARLQAWAKERLHADSLKLMVE